MNPSFRRRESLMPSIRHNVHLTTMKDKEDDLALFFQMRKRDKDNSEHLLLLLDDSQDLNHCFVPLPGSSPLFNIPTTTPARITGSDHFLNSNGAEKNDYDWLLTPPGTPLFPSLEMESRKTYMDEAEAPKAQPTVLRSRLANPQLNTTMSSNLLQRPTASTGPSSSVSGMRRPSSGGSGLRSPSLGGPGSRSVTPTGHHTLSSSKSSRPSTATTQATLSSAKLAGHSSSPKSTGPLSTRSTASTTSRSSTPTRSTARPTARPTAQSTGASRSSTPSRSTARSSTPTRSTARSITPTARPTAPTFRPTSRVATPTHGPCTSSTLPSAMPSASLNRSSSSLSIKSGSGPSRNPVPSRGASPTVKSRPWNPLEMPGFSLDAPPNLKTVLPDRPLSAARGRPTAPSARSASIEPVTNGRQRRQSCSPSRGRAPNVHASGSSVPAVSRARSKVNDDVSPVLMGTKMVERVVHMRKLAPPRQDDQHLPSSSGKSASSLDNSGFGLTLSKKSLDMAIRHMDIRRSIPGNLRPLMTKIPASSMYSVRSGPTGTRTASVCDSPIATSSNASSEQSVNNQGSEMEDDLACERNGHAFTNRVHGR